MISRRKALIAPLGALVMTALPLRKSVAATFDFYVGPNGSDTNPGTIGAPWSLAALQSKTAQIAGRRIGLLDGVYRQPLNTTQRPNLGWVQCDADGVTLEAVNARKAILTSNNGGAFPQIQGYMIDMGGDKVVVRGLRISDCHQAGIRMRGVDTRVEGCQFDRLYNWRIDGQKRDNFGAVRHLSGTDHVVSNCLFDDIQTGDADANPLFAGATAATDRSHWGMGVGPNFTVTRITVEYCTFHRVEAPLYNKRDTGTYVYRNNISCITSRGLVDFTHSDNRSDDGDKSYASGPNEAYNNVFYDLFAISGAGSEVGMYQNPTYIYNNTFLFRWQGNGFGTGMVWDAGRNVTADVLVPEPVYRFYNNIVADWLGRPAEAVCRYTGLPRDFMSTQDYNCYESFKHRSTSLTTFTDVGVWRSATGLDMHSVIGDPGLLSRSIGANLGRLANGSICRGAGRVGGVATGAKTDIGAWTDNVDRIGCDHSTVYPSPPTVAAAG